MSVSELSRRERKKEETRRRIFEAAVELFRERGFEATTVDDITEKADVARGTFFNYFPRKDSVLAYLSEERLAVAEANASVLLGGDRPARERLIEMYCLAAEAYETNRELSQYVFSELMRRSFTPGEEAGLRWHDLLVQVIEQGRRAGEVRTDVDAIRAESLLSSVYMSTVYLWLCCPLERLEAWGPSLNAEVRNRLTLVLDGLAVRHEPGGARS